MSVVLDNLDSFGRGLVTTVELTLLSYALAFVVGLLVAAFRVSPVPPLRAVGTVWVELFRNTPLLVLLFLFFFGFTKVGISYSPFVSATLVLGAYTSAFVAETVRSGFNTVPPGQAEAARALGLTFPQVLRLVVLPQSVRAVVAPLGSVFIALIKNSSLAFTIGVVELSGVADDLGNTTAQWLPVFLGTAVAYLLLTLPSSVGVSVLERRLAIRR